MKSDYFPVHAHSHFSWLDGMGTIKDMVDRVVDLDQPALALTDHGVMSGCIRLYKECMKVDIAPFPGEEFYLVTDSQDKDQRERRFHVGLLALDQKGYEALVKLSSFSHTRARFHRKPLIDLGDLKAFGQEFGEHVALTTGCFFGLPISMLRQEDDDTARRAVLMLASAFPHTFVELQNHDVVDDDHDDYEIVDTMFGIAHDLSLPVVAGQDSHYCEAGHKDAQDMMKEIGYHGTDGDDFKFPGDSFHMAEAEWVAEHYEQRQWDAIEEGHAALLDLNRLKIPELDTYKFYVPHVAIGNQNHALKRAAELGLSKLHLDVVDTYQRRLKYELGVIEQLDFADYFLLCKEVTDWCRSNGVIVNTRGSANGSLVCYAMGITNVDPLEWKTDFRRFLSLDRRKPPDIDLDVESGRRSDVIDHLRVKFPTLVQIGTYGRLGMQLDPETGEEKGSLVQQYAAAKRRRDQWTGKIDPDDEYAMQLLNEMEVYRGPGTHAGGLVLPSDELPIAKLLPTMLIASSNTTVTQPPMDDVEDAGYTKLDLLGLRSLETISKCVAMIGKTRGEFGWIPWDDKKTCTTLRSGRTMGIFQFEGPSTQRGARKMKVASTMDAVFALALFRPALMNGGQTERYLQARETGKSILVPALIHPILDDTFGVPVFQEQVIDIMRAVSLDEGMLNELLKAVKASNHNIARAEQVMKQVAPRFRKAGVGAGMTLEESKYAWRLIQEFSDYGFNRAHATSYGHMSYRSAYLKTHYPLEFMTATLDTWAGTPKERQYVQEARRLGFAIVKADVNHSGVSWAMDTGRGKPSIRRGLVTIGGVGPAAAECIAEERENIGPFKSVEDMIERLPARPVTGGKDWEKTGELAGIYRKLADAGALRSIGVESI